MMRISRTPTIYSVKTISRNSWRGLGTDWVAKLDAFLQFNERDILGNAGNISHEVAEALALKEYEKFKVEQDKNYISDFDREVKRLLKGRKSDKGKKKKSKKLPHERIGT